ncbi:hypothetical protein ACFLZP_01985 [Patescibacteria group bacterium]
MAKSLQQQSNHAQKTYLYCQPICLLQRFFVAKATGPSISKITGDDKDNV